MPKGEKGFGVIDPEVRRARGSKGGTTAHRRGTAHTWTPEEARAAGRKGGLAGKGRTQPVTAPQTGELLDGAVKKGGA